MMRPPSLTQARLDRLAVDLHLQRTLCPQRVANVDRRCFWLGVRNSQLGRAFFREPGFSPRCFVTSCHSLDSVLAINNAIIAAWLRLG